MEKNGIYCLLLIMVEVLALVAVYSLGAINGIHSKAIDSKRLLNGDRPLIEQIGY
jgi:hypothetical protein